MKYGEVPGVGKRVSRLVQGTVPVSTKKLEESFSLLDAVIEQGGTTFDTAHVYGSGDNERAFGQWMKERGNREEVVILAKGCHHNADRKRVTPWDIAADLHDSLARMKVEYVDLYVLHRDDPSVPVGPIVEALNHWKNEGLVRAFGGSNWSHDRVREANEYAAERGLAGFSATSPNFSLADQVKEPWPECITISGPRNEEARNYYAETRIPVFAWSSLAGGFFSGRITRENTSRWEDYYMKLAVECYASEENFRRLDRVAELAQRKDATIPQIAMAWVMRQGLNLFALVGCNNGEEFAQNAAALEIEISDEEAQWLNLDDERP
jgi:aryl-alcohol dehydrogenase-like predicted oxidoreductase